MGFTTLRRFAPACGCPARLCVSSIARRCTTLAGLVDIDAIVHTARPPVRAHLPLITRPRPTVSVGGSAVLIGFFAKGRPVEDLRFGFWASLPSAVRTRHRSSFAAGRSCLGFRRGPSQGVARRCASSRASWSSALATRTLSQSVACRAASSRRARTSAPRASPSFFGRTRHSPGTSAVQLVARGASSVCEGMSGPAASNTDDLLPVTDCPWNVLNGRREPLRDAACQTSFSNRPLSEAFAPSVWK